MKQYSFSDLEDGDRVVILTKNLKGRTGTIEMITPCNYLVKLDNGNYFSAHHGSLLAKCTEIKPETSLEMAILRAKRWEG